MQQTTALTDEDYLALIRRCTTDGGLSDDLLSALNIHDKRKIVRYQADRKQPILEGCLTYEVKPFLKTQGYRAGWANKSGLNRYWIIPDNEKHKRMMKSTAGGKRIRIGPKVSDGMAMLLIGRQVTEIVKNSGLSNRQYAERKGIDQGHLSLLMRGKRTMSVDTIEETLTKMGYKVNGLWLIEKE